MNSSTGLRDRILKAAQDLIAEKGFQGWTVDELSSRAHMSKRTLYRYYPSKETIIEAVMDDFFTDISAALDQLLATGSDPAAVMQNMLYQISTRGRFFTRPQGLEDLRRVYPQLWDKINRFRMERINDVLQYIYQHQHTSPINKIDPRIVSAVVQASIQTVINPAFILENGFTFDEAVQQLSSLLISSLL